MNTDYKLQPLHVSGNNEPRTIALFAHRQTQKPAKQIVIIMLTKCLSTLENNCISINIGMSLRK